jgi:hypothetical protein
MTCNRDGAYGRGVLEVFIKANNAMEIERISVPVKCEEEGQLSP